jgi:hypothetical protein
MPDNFTQTVNLREKMEKERAAMLSRAAGAERAPAAAPAAVKKPKPAVKPPAKTAAPASNKGLDKTKAEGIDEIYEDDGRHGELDNLQKISRPAAKRVNSSLYRRIVIVLAAIIALSAVYWLVFRHAPDGGTETKTFLAPKWYMVKLINGETYYGQITNVSADPVVLDTVYYNYDQLNPDQPKTEDGGNLKLVKRGKETHGPDGTMDIVRAQVVYMEPLKDDSKVLKAILDNENK